jgi:hypothetical protein
VVSIQNALPEVAEIKMWRKFSRLSARQMKYQSGGYASHTAHVNKFWGRISTCSGSP